MYERTRHVPQARGTELPLALRTDLRQFFFALRAALRAASGPAPPPLRGRLRRGPPGPASGRRLRRAPPARRSAPGLRPQKPIACAGATMRARFFSRCDGGIGLGASNF